MPCGGLYFSIFDKDKISMRSGRKGADFLKCKVAELPKDKSFVPLVHIQLMLKRVLINFYML
jgi:hypothetical protein